MAYPTLQDNGDTVTLDLHGATVDEALALTKALLREAARRGRRTVKLIHGSSTSALHGRNRTIKHALYQALDTGRYEAYVVDGLRLANTLTLSLDVTTAIDASPIRLFDIANER